MSLGKRHIGRRVTGVGVGVALMVLGLAAPAYAATSVTGFTPTSGPFGGGCVVDVTGTGFDLSPAANTTVNFVPPVGAAVPSATVTIISATELWATAPALSNGTSYTIRVDNLQGTGTASTATFTAVTGAGTCGPTITSFVPTCGAVGTVVKITGTNLLAPSQSGGLVEFSPFAAGNGIDAAVTNPDISDTVTLQVTVPTGAADGPISVTTFPGSQVFSGTAFQLPPPDCVPVGGTTHARSVSFKIKSSGKASGAVKSTEDPAFTDCVAAVPVKIQKKTNSGWKTVGKTTTTDTGSYAKKVKNPKGKQKFRALAPKVSLGDPVTDVCSKAKSAVRKV
jgi:IPT/TIG domain